MRVNSASKNHQEVVDYDVIIVGGGLVGTTLACLLATSDFKVGLVEAQAIPDMPVLDAAPKFDPRVSALTLASKNLLTNIGVWEKIENLRTGPFGRMFVWDAEGTGAIEFTAQELGQSLLGNIVENSVSVACLFDRLKSLGTVDIISPARVSELSRYEKGLRILRLEDGTLIKAKLVVGADGGLSKIRALAGIDFTELDYQQKAIVTSVRTARSNQATAWQRFLTTGPLAFLPLPGIDGCDQYSSIVWSLDTARADELMALDDGQFKLELERAFESKLGAIEWLDRRFAFPLRLRHAKTYIQEGLALVGDAAHTIHPLAGQGVNLGLLDAAVLAEELVRAQNRGIDIASDAVLGRYQRRRLADNTLMMTAMTGFKRLFGEQALPVRLLRNKGLSLVNKLGPVKNYIAAQAVGLGGDLPKLARTDFSRRVP